MKRILQIAAIVIFATLALAAAVFGVQKGVRYFLQAQTEPTPTPTVSINTVVPDSDLTFDQPPTPTPTSIPLPTYDLKDFQQLLNALGTNNNQWDLNQDGIVNNTDLTIFKTHYRP